MLSVFLFHLSVFIYIAELEVNKRTDEVFCLLHGECHFKSSTTPGRGDLAGWFPRFQLFKYIIQGDTWNCPCITKVLSREAGSGNNVQCTQDFPTILQGNQIKGSLLFIIFWTVLLYTYCYGIGHIWYICILPWVGEVLMLRVYTFFICRLWC